MTSISISSLQDLEKTDHFLIQDSTETRFAGLLTNGSNASAASQSADASPLSPAVAVAARPNERGSVLRPGGFADGNTHRGSDRPGTSVPPTGRSYGFVPQPAQVDTMPYLPTQPILRLSPSRGPSMSNDSTSGPRSSITGSSSSSSSGRISNVSSGDRDKAGLTPERVSSPSDVSPRGTPLPLKTDGSGPGSGSGSGPGPRRVTYHTSVAKGDHGIGLDLGERKERELG